MCVLLCFACLSMCARVGMSKELREPASGRTTGERRRVYEAALRMFRCATKRSADVRKTRRKKDFGVKHVGPRRVCLFLVVPKKIGVPQF